MDRGKPEGGKRQRGELFKNEGKVRDRVQRGDHRRKSRKKHNQGRMILNILNKIYFAQVISFNGILLSFEQ